VYLACWFPAKLTAETLWRQSSWAIPLALLVTSFTETMRCQSSACRVGQLDGRNGGKARRAKICKNQKQPSVQWIVGEEWLRYSVNPLGLDDFCQDGGLNLRGYKYPMSESCTLRNQTWQLKIIIDDFP
jgi:hypothetical protein